MKMKMKIIEHRKKPRIKLKKAEKLKEPKKYDYIWNLEEDGLRIAKLNNKEFLINSKDKKVSKEYNFIYYLDDGGLRKAKLNGKTYWLEVKE